MKSPEYKMVSSLLEHYFKDPAIDDHTESHEHNKATILSGSTVKEPSTTKLLHQYPKTASRETRWD